MFSLSTSWNSRLHSSGAKIIDEAKAAGFGSVELDFALSLDRVEEISALQKRGAIAVSSLHNMCPLPPDVEVDEASPDYYNFTSRDEAERNLAVDAAKNTILYAKRLGARAIVLHTGRVPIKDKTKELAAVFGDKARYAAVKQEMIRERLENKDGYLDNAIRSLKELIPVAVKCGIRIGIETRYSYRDMPLLDEFETIFKEVKDVWYWHDVGHAEAFERLGLVSRHEDYLERFADRLIGVHLHDIIDLNHDHLAPLCGTFDFRRLVPYLKKDTIKVIEAHQPATADELKRALDHLEKLFGR